MSCVSFLKNNNVFALFNRIITGTQPPKILLYIIVSIIGVIVLCIILILIIVISYRRKKMTSSQSDLSDTMRSMGVSTMAGNGHNIGSSGDTNSPGFAVCDEQDVVKEQETNRFLCNYSDLTQNGGSTLNSQNMQNSVSFADENTYANNTMSSTYGWTEFNNPYVTQCNTNGNYQNFQHQQTTNGYIPNYYNQPMYAKPVPKSQRNNVYSNPMPNNNTSIGQHPVIANLQHSTPQSPSNSSGSSNLANSLTYRSQNNNLAGSILSGQNRIPSSLSGEDRVPSISPPITDGAAAEQVRLISSNSNTPTKSILKKPKDSNHLQQQQNYQACPTGLAPLCVMEDQSSQSSSDRGAKEERSSESSNISFSDRDTPVETNNLTAVGAATTAPQSQNDLDRSHDPDFSPSNTYLETSFEGPSAENGAGSKVPPPTLPKPSKLDESKDEEVLNASTLDKKIRNITQV